MTESPNRAYDILFSMQTNQWAIGALVAVVLVGGGFYLWSSGFSGWGKMEKYQLSSQGISFSYPSDYELTQERERDVERPWHVIVLTHESSIPAPENGEAPPVIAVVILDNVGSQSLEEWVLTSEFSNFQLSQSGEFASTTVDGMDAIGYRYSGLYETEAVATVRDDKIYLFSVGWIDENDQIRQDFQALVDSVEFI